MEQKRITPMKAIRLKCLDCCCGSAHEVKLCAATQCPLYPFREGKNPNVGTRGWTEERREEQRQRMAQNIHSKGNESKK
jgi:hypothetical protein